MDHPTDTMFNHDHILNTIEEQSRNVFEIFNVETVQANARAREDAEEPLDEWRVLNWPVPDVMADSLESSTQKLNKMKTKNIDIQNIGMISGNYLTPSRQRNPQFMHTLITSLKRLDYDKIKINYQQDNPNADHVIEIPHHMRVFLHEVFTHVEQEFNIYKERVEDLKKYEIMYAVKGAKYIPLGEISKIYELGQILEAIEGNRMTDKLMKSKGLTSSVILWQEEMWMHYELT